MRAIVHHAYISNVAFAILQMLTRMVMPLSPFAASKAYLHMTLHAAIGGAVIRRVFILRDDLTAEYEYENVKKAVESDWVVIFMRIRHNVFTSWAANCT